MWRIGLVGTGTMGSVHAHAYSHMEDAKVVGIVDIDEVAGTELANRYGAVAYSSLEALLAAQEVDVIDVCVPTPWHREYVEKAATAKKHVICEKPLARTLEDAQAMMDACERNGVRLFVGHVVRFFPEYQMAHDAVAAGNLGQIGVVRTMRGGQYPTAWQDWYASPAMSGTLLVDMVIHDFDFLRWCFGDVSRVYAKSMLGRDINRLDHAFVSLRFNSGVIGHVEGTWAYPSGFHTELEIAGQGGLIAHKSDDAVPVHLELRAEQGQGQGVMVPDSPMLKNPYQLELEHFIECLTDGKEARVTPLDAYRALEIGLAALESVQTGQVVELGGVKE